MDLFAPPLFAGARMSNLPIGICDLLSGRWETSKFGKVSVTGGFCIHAPMHLECFFLKNFGVNFFLDILFVHFFSINLKTGGGGNN